MTSTEIEMRYILPQLLENNFQLVFLINCDINFVINENIKITPFHWYSTMSHNFWLILKKMQNI